jgi:SpoVK/Ycf46/Vps4 family AAA+-type ATPase
VSDFLESGGPQVEARAKNIFKVLMTQPSCVILFDEIDHFLLDRDSVRYSGQDTLFQFMTPGMLTKINDLRRSERALFVVATNYEDRIDAAIKRTGRVDKKYLVLPPDSEKRISLVKHFLKRVPEEKVGKIAKNFKAKDKSLKGKSVFLGFKDIEAAVQSWDLDSKGNVESLIEKLDGRARTTSLEGYQSRFIDSEKLPLAERETPMKEFICLMALALESDINYDFPKSRAIADAGLLLDFGKNSSENKKKIKKYSGDISPEILEKLLSVFKKSLEKVPKS